jgi:putative ABC transport system substrate-binding protein
MQLPAFNSIRSVAAALLAGLLLCAPAPQARCEALAVIYPDIGEPYRRVFSEIIGGIEEQSKAKARAFPVAAGSEPADVQSGLRAAGARVVIALGRLGMKAASTLDPSVAVVVGGVSAVPDPDKLTGISLMPDPALLFTQLRALVPGVRRVLVVYNPLSNEPLIKLAREAAKAQGLELQALEALDLAAAARRYEAALASADARRDALWLPQDLTTVDETTILPIVLRESWNRGLPIFSSSVLHVKKGALFALYPNNAGLGRELAALAMSLQNGEPVRRGIAPLRSVHAALNSRTASHIGLTLAPGQQQAFDAIYPEP